LSPVIKKNNKHAFSTIPFYLQMQPSWTRRRMLLRSHHRLSSSPVLLLLSVSFFIFLWSSPMAATAALDPRTVEPSKEEAGRWMDATKSREKQKEGDPCNASPYLTYLRSQLKELRKEFLSAEPLAYSFYVKNVLQPYRSLLPEANAPSTSFCYLDKNFFDCSKRCPLTWDPLVCLPNSDSSTEGTCVGCRHLNTAIQAGALKDEASMRHLNATCDPISRRGPKSAPHRKTNEARWLRWLLESSFIFEGQKAGANCSAGPGLSKARYHLDVLMRKHFGKRKDDDDLTLTTPGKEGPEEELKYEGVREELNSDEQQRKLYEQKFEGIIHESGWFPEVYCSREEGLVCMGGKCVGCGDEGVKEDGELMEVCGLKEEGGRKKGGGGGSSGPQGGHQQSSELTAVVVGLVVLTLFGSFRWCCWWW
jgi:hypothetical protein